MSLLRLMMMFLLLLSIDVCVGMCPRRSDSELQKRLLRRCVCVCFDRVRVLVVLLYLGLCVLVAAIVEECAPCFAST